VVVSVTGTLYSDIFTDDHWRRLVSGESGSGRCLDAEIGTWVCRVIQ
jgi:hypothetical protein